MTDLQEALRRLASRFVAQDIMRTANKLVSGDSEADARKRLEGNPRFDIIPIFSGGTLLAFLERGQARAKAIEIPHLVGAGTPIPDVVDSMSGRRFVLVVGREHPVISDAGFVRGGMRGRFKASAYWPERRRIMVARNPQAECALRTYGPERVQ